MAEDTIFDQFVQGRVPVEKVYEDDYVLAFPDINPQAPVHVLVLPKDRSSRFAQLKDKDPQAVGRFFAGIARTAAALGLEEGGYRVVLNNGKDGGQTVEYLHAHILGGRRMTWPPG